MSIARASVLRGPAVAQFGGVTFFSQADIETDLNIETFAPESSAHGALDERVMERQGRVRFTPVGEWESLGVLWPYRAALIGSSIFGAADQALVIHSIAGQKHTAPAAAVMSMPEIYFGSRKTSIGQVEFGISGKDNTAWTGVDSFWKIETEAFPAATWALFDPTKVVTEPPTINWATGGAGTTFKTVDGATVSFELAMDPVETDEDGIIDYTLGNVGAMAKFRPLGQTETEIRDLLKLQDAGAWTRGAKLSSKGYDLTISNSLGSIVLHKATLVSGGYRFGRTTLRNGELGFVAARTFTAGIRDPLWTLA